MNRFKLISVILLALSVTACGNDPQDASEENFKTAINRILADDPICIESGDFKRLRHTVPFSFPWTYNPNTWYYVRDYVAGTIDALDMFESVGLLEKEEKLMKKRKAYGGGNLDVMVPTYNLTDGGKNVFKNSGFCYGVKQVVEIINYTEPTKQMGQSAVQVQYTLAPKITEDWIRDDAFKAWVDKIEKSILTPEKNSMTLVLTKKGWFSPWELR